MKKKFLKLKFKIFYRIKYENLSKNTLALISKLYFDQEIQEQKNNEKIQQLELDLMNSTIHGKIALRALLESVVKTTEKLSGRVITDSETPGANGTSTYFIMVAEELQENLTKLKLVHENYSKDNDNNVEALQRKVQSCGHLLAMGCEVGYNVCHQSKNIDWGESKFHAKTSFLILNLNFGIE